VSLPCLLVRCFRPSALYIAARDKVLAASDKMAIPGVYVGDTEAEGERWIERDR